jgi:hypothetical protein
VNTGAAAAAAAQPDYSYLSDEALAHLKDYKYSSVDKSPISRYILKHYVSVLFSAMEPIFNFPFSSSYVLLSVS